MIALYKSMISAITFTLLITVSVKCDPLPVKEENTNNTITMNNPSSSFSDNNLEKHYKCDVAHCISCFSDNLCSVCNSGYFAMGGICSSCLPNCLECEDVLGCTRCSPDTHLKYRLCKKCYTNEYWDEFYGNCVYCEAGKTYDYALHICVTNGDVLTNEYIYIIVFVVVFIIACFITFVFKICQRSQNRREPLLISNPPLTNPSNSNVNIQSQAYSSHNYNSGAPNPIIPANNNSNAYPYQAPYYSDQNYKP